MGTYQNLIHFLNDGCISQTGRYFSSKTDKSPLKFNRRQLLAILEVSSLNKSVRNLRHEYFILIKILQISQFISASQGDLINIKHISDVLIFLSNLVQFTF